MAKTLMMNSVYSTIVGTGSYLPENKVRNKDFREHRFLDVKGNRFDRTPEEIIEKFERITNITERRHVSDDLLTSDIGYLAAQDALTSSGFDKEALDYIIFAHNFGDVTAGNNRTSLVPSLASRVKCRLEIENPYTIPYDLPFGCPGWLQGMVQADYFIKSGDVKKILVIGADILSRVSDPHDRDSLIYADGAGATLVEAKESESPVGIIAHKSRSDTRHHAFTLRMGASYNPEHDPGDLFLKMDGHKLYKYALETVPQVVKDSIDKAGLSVYDVDRFLIHQANAKMDEAILKRVYEFYGKTPSPENIMPMTISWLGNSSVATLPTMLDLLLKGKLQSKGLQRGNVIVFVSFGAGINVNCIVYRIP